MKPPLTLHTGTVEDIPDEKLIKRAVRNAVGSDRTRMPWVLVMTAFGLGSTYAAQLCRRFGIDPNKTGGVY